MSIALKKMSKENQEDQIHKSHKLEEKHKNITNMAINSLNTFISHQSKQKNVFQSQLKKLTELNEQIKCVESCKKSAFDELNQRLKDKSQAVDELNIKCEALEQTLQRAHTALLAQNKKCVELEMSYQESRRSMKETLEQFKQKVSSVNDIVSAKEAECATYLKDMRTQLEMANEKNLQSEQLIPELQAKVSELENKLEEFKAGAKIEKKNAEMHYKKQSAKINRRLRKKIQLLDEMDKKVKTLEMEKKALKASLKMEGYKIRDLQRVLNRPIHVGSPIVDNETEQRRIEHVDPVQQRSSPSLRAASPVFDLNANPNEELRNNVFENVSHPIRPLSGEGIYMNEAVRTQETVYNLIDGIPSSEVRKRKSANQLGELNRLKPDNRSLSAPNSFMSRRTPSLSEDESSSDIFPPYVPNKELFNDKKRSRK